MTTIYTMSQSVSTFKKGPVLLCQPFTFYAVTSILGDYKCNFPFSIYVYFDSRYALTFP